MLNLLSLQNSHRNKYLLVPIKWREQAIISINKIMINKMNKQWCENKIVIMSDLDIIFQHLEREQFQMTTINS